MSWNVSDDAVDAIVDVRYGSDAHQVPAAVVRLHLALDGLQTVEHRGDVVDAVRRSGACW